MLRNRYANPEKFITNPAALAQDQYGYISISDLYDIAVDLDGNMLEPLRMKIAQLGKYIGELDYLVQQYYFTEIRDVGTLAYDLSLIRFQEGNKLVLEYWGTVENNAFEVIFLQEGQTFSLQTFGRITEIPDRWKIYIHAAC